jgi:hypothetical protein
MRHKAQLQMAAAVAALGVVSGCGSASHPSSSSGSQQSGLGDRAPTQLTGTFTATFSRRDAAGAPKPDELPIELYW